MTTILGIESSCDDTAIGIVSDGKTVLANEIASQTTEHAQYGGVFPEIAAREHEKCLLPLIEQALDTSSLTLSEIDCLAVAEGPGLMGSLLMGVATAQALSLHLQKPLTGVNHVAAHLYSPLMGESTPCLFPSLGIVLSGGHTFVSHLTSPTNYTIIGTTVDDAIGEAFDKVGSLLGLTYPAGPAIENLAKQGDPHLYSFKGGEVKKRPLDFSFSGLKTNVFYTIYGKKEVGKTEKSLAPPPLSFEEKAGIAASFQQTAFSDVITKIKRALSIFPCKALYFGGGVTANQALRKTVEQTEFAPPVFWPPLSLTTDNGAMIAGLAFHLFQEKKARFPTPFPKMRF